MTSHKALRHLVAAGALFALPPPPRPAASRKMHDCLFGWTQHFTSRRAVKGNVHKKKAVKKVKKAKAAKAMPKK